MIGGLGLDSLFSSAQLGILSGGVDVRDDIKPTQADIDHAVSSIREWRVYLPLPCVAAMIKDGWQWST
jgi:hypothetical protein